MRTQSGFTLVEAVVVTAVFVGFTALVYGTFHGQRSAFERESAASMTQTGVRYWLERIARDVRRACYDPQRTRSFGIVTHEPGEIRVTFAVDTNGDGVADGSGMAGYRAHDGVLQLWDGGTWRSLVEGVENLEFIYRDATGVESAESIALVEIGLSAHAATAGAPGSPLPLITQTIAAEIRNDTHCKT